MSELKVADTPVLECQRLSKVFAEARQPVSVLEELDLQVGRGERIAIIGASGSGKST